MSSIDYYERLVASGLKNLEPEEVDLIKFERDEIHECILRGENVDVERIKELDAELQGMCSDIPRDTVHYFDKPSSQWWWHIERLGQLSEKDKKTL